MKFILLLSIVTAIGFWLGTDFLAIATPLVVLYYLADGLTKR